MGYSLHVCFRHVWAINRQFNDTLSTCIEIGRACSHSTIHHSLSERFTSDSSGGGSEGTGVGRGKDWDGKDNRGRMRSMEIMSQAGREKGNTRREEAREKSGRDAQDRDTCPNTSHP